MNRILVIGANGFMGKAICKELEESYDVVKSSREGLGDLIKLDAKDFKSVLKVIETVRPEVIVNCAGIVKNDKTAVGNVDITMNLLRAIKEAGGDIRLIVSGSSAVYGIADELPIREDSEIKPVSEYGKYKALESLEALKFGKENNIDVVVLRIFNPIGSGMADKFLIPSLMRQIKDFSASKIDTITITRLDAVRDYIDVRDVAMAFKDIVSTKKHDFLHYNVGSGKKTTNKQIIDTLAKELKVKNLQITESSSKPDPVSSQADISRIQAEFGWKPTYSLKLTLKEIIKND